MASKQSAGMGNRACLVERNCRYGLRLADLQYLGNLHNILYHKSHFELITWIYQLYTMSLVTANSRNYWRYPKELP